MPGNPQKPRTETAQVGPGNAPYASGDLVYLNLSRTRYDYDGYVLILWPFPLTWNPGDDSVQRYMVLLPCGSIVAFILEHTLPRIERTTGRP